MELDLKAIAQLAEEDPEAAKEMVRKYRKAMIVLARNDPSWFCQYVLKNRDGGMIRQQPHHHKMHQTILENQRSLIWTFPECGKELSVNELIPTPTGWKRMGDIVVGDTVYDRFGQPTAVTGAFEVNETPTVYELTLDDGVKIRAGADHQWLAYNAGDRHKSPRSLRLTNTAEIFRTLRTGDRATWALPVAGAVNYPVAGLPIPPYLLGAWLGDGSKDAVVITHHSTDVDIVHQCAQQTGLTLRSRRDSRNPEVMSTKIGDSRTRRLFKSLNLLTREVGRSRKHIPELYKHASIEQRFALLAGLLDTDGTASKRSPGHVELCLCNKRLAEDALELIRSLGIKAHMHESDAKLRGRVTGKRYRITFTTSVPVFSLARKLDIQTARRSEVGSKAKLRYIVDAREVESEPMRCISVAAEDRTYLFGRHYTVTHNTSQIAIGHVLWRLGKDPNRSFGILSNAAQMAANIVGAMKCEVKGTKVLRADGVWVPIESLVEWTKLKTLDPRTWRYVEVTGRSAFNSNERCYRIEFANGHTMRVTENHPLLVLAQDNYVWRAAKDIKPGNLVVAISDYSVEECTSADEVPPEAAELVGYLLAGRLDGDDIVVRKMNRQRGWIERRAEFFSKLGWTLRDNGKWAERVSGGDITPGEYAKQVVIFKDGWPVDVHEAIWKLDDSSIRRLLSAFWSAGFMKTYTNTRKRNGFLGGSIGLGDCRVPSHIEHVSKPTLDLLRRLFMRAGVRAKISRSKYNAFENLGGICKRKRNVNKELYRLSIDAVDIGRFWPVLNTRHQEKPVHYLEKVVKIEKTPRNLETWALEVRESQHSYISGGILSHNTYIAESPELHDVFPNLKPGDRWAANSFTVQRNTIRKDPSVTAIGLTGKFLGARFDGLVLDDVDSVETVLTPEARDLTERIVRTKALSRLSEDGWAVAIGNVWDREDLMHRLEKTGWKSLRFPVMDAKTGLSNDPENFPMPRIEAIRDEDQGPLEFSRLYMLEPRAEGEERFRMEWIEAALLKGKQSFLLKEGLIKVPPGCRTVTGVDLGIKKKSTSDPTAVITVLEIPTNKERSDYQLLNIEFGRWNVNETMEKIAEQQRLFNSEVWVESNGAQEMLIQIMNMAGRSCRVNAFYTGRNKYDPMYGVESLANELAMGCWTMPSWEGNLESAEPEVRKLCDEMYAYMPNKHTGDLLMALWIAREGARTSKSKSENKVEFGRIRLRR